MKCMANNQPVEIIAGPCAIDARNKKDIWRIAQTGVVAKVRFVPAKSRTAYKAGEFRGVDAPFLERKIKQLVAGKIDLSASKEEPPSLAWAREFRTKFPKVGLAMEVMSPSLQLPYYMDKKIFGGGALLVWSPSAQQLGWPLRIMGEFANRCGWTVGVKNGKWLGERPALARRNDATVDVEKTWAGLATWAVSANRRGRNILIHRGFNAGAANKNFRNLPIHEIAARMKQETGLKMFFDPSHSFGAKLRNKITDGTLAAMKMVLPNGQYLYDGILIEAAGEHSAQVDTGQHISIGELETLANKIEKVRGLVLPQ